LSNLSLIADAEFSQGTLVSSRRALHGSSRAYHTAAVKLEHARYHDDMMCLILL